MAKSEIAFGLGFQVTWHVVHMVTICMRADGNSASATHMQHHSLSTQETVSRHAEHLRLCARFPKFPIYTLRDL
jgi:hypothetical protein